jgi:hypothetical protein
MIKKFPLKTLTAAMLMAGSGSVLAIEAASMELGGMRFTPVLNLSESYDDNIRAVGAGADESSWITTINPNFELAAQDRLNLYKLTYGFNSDTFHSSHDDNNVDHFLNAIAHMEYNARNRLDLNAGYSKVEDINDTEGGFGINDKYHTYNLGAVYGFGAKSATMNFEFGANQQWLRYDNDQRLGNGLRVNEDQERDVTTLSGTAFYRVAPKTRALLEVRYNEYKYKLSSSTLDSDAMAYLLGLTWEATAKTTGIAKFGYSNKEFDDSSRDDVNGSIWEVGVDWQPRTYSTFSLNTRRSTEEGSEGAEDAIDTTRTGINWKHDWTSRISTDVGYTYMEEDYQGISRKDETDEFGLGLSYNMRRWLDLGVGYTYQDVESKGSNSYAYDSYDRNIFLVKLTMGL